MMDNATNNQLGRLDRRLQTIYNDAHRLSLARERVTIARLAAEREDEELSYAERRNIQRAANNIADEIASGGNRAAQAIAGAALGVYISSYLFALNDVREQIPQGIRFTQYTEHQLRVILADEAKSPFTQVAYNRLGADPIAAKKKILPRLRIGLADSVMRGASIQQISRMIRNVINISYRQAVKIARTEMNRVANQGRLLGFEQAKSDHNIDMQKMWLSAFDERTRDAHLAANGQVVDLDKPFNVGGEKLMFPGDPNGSAENVINCRCSVVSILRGFSF